MKILTENTRVISVFEDNQTLFWTKLKNEVHNITSKEFADSLTVGGNIADNKITGYKYRIPNNTLELFDNITVPTEIDLSDFEKSYSFDGTNFSEIV